MPDSHMNDLDAVEASIERKALAAAIEELRREQVDIRDELKKNGELTKKNNEMTQEMFDIFSAAKGAFKLLGWIGSAIKWTGIIAAAATAVWVFVKGGGPPSK